MICDEKPDVREKGIRMIGLARANKANAEFVQKQKIASEASVRKVGRPKKQMDSGIRSFIKPTPENEFKLNFEATHYYKLVNLGDNIYEPPMTIGLSLDRLKQFNKPKLSHHNQPVEYFVQEVNEAAKNVASEDSRNANVLVTSYYRKNLEHCRNKEEIEGKLQEIVEITKSLKTATEPDVELDIGVADIYLKD